ncbi:MAG: hypothetical protein ACYC1K_01425 [Minisyncoccota bacterium]
MEIDISNLHHAYLILGEQALSESLLLSSFEEMGVKEMGNPDFHAYRVESFDIASARALRERAMEKPFGDKKIFLISAERFTPEAQNALLKTLEEPGENMHFFILLREQDLLLPTLLSRMHTVRPNQKNPAALPSLRGLRHGQDFSDSNSSEEFLKMSPRDRLNFAKDFADKEKSLPVFLDSLSRYLKSNQADSETLDTVFKVRRFADDPSVMPRLVLEHLALVLK